MSSKSCLDFRRLCCFGKNPSWRVNEYYWLCFSICGIEKEFRCCARSWLCTRVLLTRISTSFFLELNELLKKVESIEEASWKWTRKILWTNVAELQLAEANNLVPDRDFIKVEKQVQLSRKMRNTAKILNPKNRMKWNESQDGTFKSSRFTMVFKKTRGIDCKFKTSTTFR